MMSMIDAIDNDQVKVHPITCHVFTEGEQRYSYTLSLTSDLYRVGHRAGQGECRKISPQPLFDTRTIQPLASLFCVLLTVHLSIILDHDQLDTHLIYFTIRLL